MKTNLAVAALATLVISACATAPKETTAEAPAQEATENKAQAAPGVETGTVRPAEVSSSEFAAQLDEMQKQSVYFDFGEFVIKPEYNGLIQHHADFMKAHPNAVVTLQGNTDERGSSEYNLALGDRRANAVRKALEVLGVPDSQIRTVSLGEEHPRLTCHEEQCWKENRRTDFIGKITP
ncbi:MAG TPA: peptidoglycan-associated lipoprotein Pal [Gallionella sp.]|nr:peptidoglycan-associated lipoprotein Pal [Gallionella sp.]